MPLSVRLVALFLTTLSPLCANCAERGYLHLTGKALRLHHFRLALNSRLTDDLSSTEVPGKSLSSQEVSTHEPMLSKAPVRRTAARLWSSPLNKRSTTLRELV